MRLVRYGIKDQEKPGLIDSAGVLRGLSAIVADIDGAALSHHSLKKLAAVDVTSLPPVPGNPRLGACVSGVGKVIGVAVNYRLHGVETGPKQPTEPV